MYLSNVSQNGVPTLDYNRMKNSMLQASASGALAAMPSTDFVLSPSLLNQMSESQAVTEQVVRSYQSRINEVETPEMELLGDEEEDNFQTIADEILAKGQDAVDRINETQEELVEVREATDAERSTLNLLA